jgi:hypothetical protein
MIVKEYTKKKLVEYLEQGKKYLIVFNHGLGDTMMFYPVYEYLRDKYATTCQIDLHVEYGQETIFKSWPFTEQNYDACFIIHFPMAEATPFTKSEYCCMWEIGIDYKNVSREVAELPVCRSPIVGLHLQGTSMDKVVSCPEGLAQIIWEEVKEAGYIPMEMFFQHCFYNPANKKYDFVDNTCRGGQATISNLTGAISHCSAFIGVVSGPLLVALSTMPGRVCCLQRGFKLDSFIKRDKVYTVDFMNEYKFNSIRDWLKGLSK